MKTKSPLKAIETGSYKLHNIYAGKDISRVTAVHRYFNNENRWIEKWYTNRYLLANYKNLCDRYGIR